MVKRCRKRSIGPGIDCMMHVRENILSTRRPNVKVEMMTMKNRTMEVCSLAVLVAFASSSATTARVEAFQTPPRMIPIRRSFEWAPNVFNVIPSGAGIPTRTYSQSSSLRRRTRNRNYNYVPSISPLRFVHTSATTASRHRDTALDSATVASSDIDVTRSVSDDAINTRSITNTKEQSYFPELEKRILNDQRYSASDWFQNVRSVPRSTILRTIRGPVIAVMAWSTFVSIAHKVLRTINIEWASKMCMKASIAHSLTVSILGLLLVFRTNSAYQRFNEGRLIWEDIHSTIRNLSRMIVLYREEYDTERLDRIFRLLSSFPYLLHHHVVLPHKQCAPSDDDDEDVNDDKPTFLFSNPESIQKKQLINNLSPQHRMPIRQQTNQKQQTRRQESRIIMKLKKRGKATSGHALPSEVYAKALRKHAPKARSAKSQKQQQQSTSKRTVSIYNENSCDVCYVDRRTVPWSLLPKSTLLHCANSLNRPIWVVDRIGYEINQVPYRNDEYTNRERMALLSYLGKLSTSVGKCERIHQTAVPLNYARHSLRSLTVWLFTLPFVLVDTFGWYTGITMGLVSWMLYGIYQIGYTLEDPFQDSLRLQSYCDAIYHDIDLISMIPQQVQSSSSSTTNRLLPSNGTTISLLDCPRMSAFQLQQHDLHEEDDEVEEFNLPPPLQSSSTGDELVAM